MIDSARLRTGAGAFIVTRVPAASTIAAVAGLLVLLGLSWHFTDAGIGGGEMAWLLLTVLSILAGAAALGWLRPARVGFTAPQLMLLLGACGMVAGLWLDARQGGFAAIAALCFAEPGDLAGTLALHWRQLPLMHIGMVAGGLATVPLLRRLRQGCRRQFCARLAQNLACSGWMVIGMAAGTVAFMHLTGERGERGAAAMLGGMFGGMVWGMVASVALYRLWIRMSEPHG
jgi:hypothetical protein